MQQAEHSPFPSDETLAAYLDGQLDEETRQRVVWHIAECAECLDIVTANNEMKAAPVVRGVNWQRNSYIVLTAAAALAAVFFMTPARELIMPPDGIRQLASVAPPKRSIDGRITSFPYRERAPTMRGTKEEREENEVDLTLLNVAAELQKRAEEHPTARTLHAEGVAYLMTGHTPDAVRVLENVRPRTLRGPKRKRRRLPGTAHSRCRAWVGVPRRSPPGTTSCGSATRRSGRSRRKRNFRHCSQNRHEVVERQRFRAYLTRHDLQHVLA